MGCEMQKQAHTSCCNHRQGGTMCPLWDCSVQVHDDDSKAAAHVAFGSGERYLVASAHPEESTLWPPSPCSAATAHHEGKQWPSRGLPSSIAVRARQA